MTVLMVKFKGGMFGRSAQGQITIANPTETIKFTKQQIRQDMTITHPLEGNWFGFPKGKVGRMDVIAHTDQDYKWFDILVSGAEQGNFSGTMYLWHANTVTPVRFDGFSPRGKPIFRSDYYEVRAILTGATQRMEAASPVVSSPGQFVARISRVVRGNHPSGDIPVVVWFDIQQVPVGTETLTLAFVTDREWPQGVNTWNGAGQHDFVGHVWKGYAGVIGKPAGKEVSIETTLRAEAGGVVLAELRNNFTLDVVG